MKTLKQLLSGGDRRSLGRVQMVSNKLRSDEDLDKLFPLIYSSDRTVAMRAIDTLEKATRTQPSYLYNHGRELIEYGRNTKNSEIKWHIAQMLPRVPWTSTQFKNVFSLLNYWTSNPNESKIVRANSLEGLYHLCQQTKNKRLKVIVRNTIRRAERNQIPSLAARARKLSKLSIPDA